MSMALSIGLISLIIFGNIENLILASQGVVKAANPLKLAIFSLIFVTCWLIIGTVCTKQLEVSDRMSSFKDFVNEYKPFLGLLIFGNIENLVLSAQGVIEGADPLLVAGLSILVVVVWQFIGVFGTKSAMKYSRHIEFIGGFAIFVLGIQSMLPLIYHLI